MKNKVRLFFSKTTAGEVFCYALLILSMIWEVLLLMNPEGRQLEAFFGRGRDLLADFINNCVLGYNRDIYNVHPSHMFVIFPSFAYFLIALFIPLANKVGALDSAIVFCAIPTILIATQVYFGIKQGERGLGTIAIMCSLPILYVFERGNPILYAAAFAMFFLQNYDNAKKWRREAAFWALAMAAGVKCYPGIFAVMLLLKKDYKGFAKTVLYSAIVLILPFCFLPGGAMVNIGYWLRNVRTFISPYWPTCRMFGPVWPMQDIIYPAFGWEWTEKAADNLFLIAKGITILGWMVVPFLKKRWKQMFLLACTMLFFMDTAGYYVALYLIPPLVELFNEEGRGKAVYGYLGLFLVAFMPLQFGEISFYIANVAMMVLWVILIGEGIIGAWKWGKAVKLRKKLNHSSI